MDIVYLSLGSFALLLLLTLNFLALALPRDWKASGATFAAFVATLLAIFIYALTFLMFALVGKVIPGPMLWLLTLITLALCITVTVLQLKNVSQLRGGPNPLEVLSPLSADSPDDAPDVETSQGEATQPQIAPTDTVTPASPQA